MSLFDIYKAKKLGAGAGSLFDAKAGGKLNKDAWKKGFNKWDEEWKVATVSSESRVCNKNPIKVIPDEKYYIKTPQYMYINAVTENGSYVAYIGAAKDKVITVPSNASYIAFSVLGSYGTTYNNDICINISGEHDGEYVPYNG